MSELPTPSSSHFKEVLKRKRKPRDHQACTKRQHPEICTFSITDVPHESDVSPSEDKGQASIPKSELEKAQTKLNGIVKDVADLQDFFNKYNGTPELQSPKFPSSSISVSSPQKEQPEPLQAGSSSRQARKYKYGSNYEKGMNLTEYNESTDEYHHIGGGSSAALAQALGKVPKDRGDRRRFQEIFGKNMLSRFGLETTNVTYPFTELWDDSRGLKKLKTFQKVLPSRTECLGTVRRFFTGSNVTYPTLSTREQFEEELERFFGRYNIAPQNMNSSDPETESSDEKTFRWLGLLFAVLASGTQFTPEPSQDTTPEDTQYMAHVYCRCSFECLKMVDYLASPTVEVVQTFFILSTVLANNMKAGSAWNVLGLTLRLGVDIGLDTAAERATSSDSERTKSELWWAILCADSALSLGFGRTACAPQSETRFTPPDSTSEHAAGWSYIQCTQRLTKISYSAMHNWVAQQSLQSRLAKCTQLRSEVEQLQHQAAPHLRDVDSCTGYRQECEYWRFALRAAYIKSEFYRLAVVPGTPELDRDRTLRSLYIRYLIETVEAFNGLARAAKVQTRSWDVLHPALSASILLSILKEMSPGSRAHAAVHDLVDLMRDRAGVAQGGEFLALMAKSISALLKYCGEEESIPNIMTDTPQISHQNRGAQNSQVGASSTKLNDSKLGILSWDTAMSNTMEAPSGVRSSDNPLTSGTLPLTGGMPGPLLDNETALSSMVGQFTGLAPMNFQTNGFLTPMISGNELESGSFNAMPSTFWGNGAPQQHQETNYSWGGASGTSAGGSTHNNIAEGVLMSPLDEKDGN
ncbi:MAG: hypothetical protein M1831_005532 [Alyxoria varia]|nr:MAG: hypothetical protein M1831_005532 [Alyxoria varia]